MWRRSVAMQPVSVKPSTVYKISFDARGPDRGAALFLRAELVKQYGSEFVGHEELGLTAEAEEISTEWRHFEWTARTYPVEDYDPIRSKTYFRLFTIGERPIEVRNASLRESHREQPSNFGNKLQPGRQVYRKLIELPPVKAGMPKVAIYENLLAQPIVQGKPMSSADIQQLKYMPQSSIQPAEIADISLKATWPPWRDIIIMTLPGGLIYANAMVFSGRKRRKTNV